MAVLSDAAVAVMVANKDAFLAIHPNNRTIPNPAYDDQIPEHPDTNPKRIPEFSDLQWLHQYVKEHMELQIERGEKIIYNASFVPSDVSL